MTTYLVLTGKTDAKQLAAVPPDAAAHHVLESVRDLPAALAAR
jgi:hypothetical protein